MDLFTFIIIGIFIYSFFSKKDKPPQRSQRPVDHTPTQSPRQERPRPARKKQEGFFESLERQIRESAEALEKELDGRKAREVRKSTDRSLEKPIGKSMESPMDRSRGKSMERPGQYEPKTAIDPESYQGVEGAWGTEGRTGVEGRTGTEGRRGTEGLPGVEGTSDYSRYQSKQGKVLHAEKSFIEKTSIETGAPKAKPQPKGLERAVGFSSSPIVQGIIWSEILKEPRAKRHFSRK